MDTKGTCCYFQTLRKAIQSFVTDADILKNTLDFNQSEIYGEIYP